ncbi:MAG: N-6 DNA methylase [Prevotella sp.]|nr:N-6 DNA methylase [Prevotella sp.]
MITENNLRNVLITLGFTGDMYNRYLLKVQGDVIAVDFAERKLIYPKGVTVHDATTSNFEHNENFVVFECVCRLLLKGYRPEHIELEPRWIVGHGASGGKADILIRDDKGASYIIIECKTAGAEYNKERKNTEEIGGQLFSYWQQEESTKWLALYASDYKDGKIVYTSHAVHSEDDANILKLAERDKDILTYARAHTAVERYAVWDEIYGKEWVADPIFNADSTAYNVGIPPLRKRDLRDFKPEDKIVNRFEEILRHNNVSDKENAFNRLTALFICKLVDESTKQDYEEVDFQYKQGTDTYETLQDRLQRLHSQGMKEFMREDIIYIPADYAEKLFSRMTRSKRREAVNELNATIRKLKFYSNNDFAFKDVHNEELFLQNGKILVEVVQLFQNYRIVYQSRHQFLGDLFEQLLNKGFKQNEGQFFTPVPITRFVWDALPVADYISRVGQPKVIDYACGAGHFLTEAVEAINDANRRKDEGNRPADNTWTERYIFGVEKDYRLARVSKISMFMNGAGGANIIFGDGLENYPDKGIAAGAFDILVANPPYSVKAFKQHLKLKNNTFDLLPKISNDSGEIETLFVERITQLLRPRGLAAVILPVSILTNNSADYIAAREKLLENFLIRAIAVFGSKTFGATGTNTAMLFLERYNEPPRIAALMKDSVESVFNGDTPDDFPEDGNMLRLYLEDRKVSLEDYQHFLSKTESPDHWAEHGYFKIYTDAFKRQTIKYPKNTTNEQKEAIRKEKFYKYALATERDKLYYFALAYTQTTLVVTAPTDNNGQTEFLGYAWSNRKGNEGIIPNPLGGKLYNINDRYATGTIARAVRNSFAGGITQIDTQLGQYIKYYKLKDLINFDTATFNKEIATTAKVTQKVSSKYELVNLAKFAKGIDKGTNITEANTTEGPYKVVAGGKSYAYMHNEYNREPDVITVSASGTAGFVNLWKERIFASDCITIYGKDNTETSYIYYYLKSIQDFIYSLKTGANQPHVYAKDLETIQIPAPPNNIINQIVAECEAIDNEYSKCSAEIETYKAKINRLFDNLHGSNPLRLSDPALFDIFIGKRVTSDMMSDEYDIPVYSANVFEPFGKINKQLITDYSTDSVLWGIDGDWMVNVIKQGTPFYPTDHCGVIRIKTEQILPKVLAYSLKKEGERVRFSRSYRASTERVKSLTIAAPPIEAQREAAREADGYEQEILKAQAVMTSCAGRIQAVLDRYLLPAQGE